MNHTYSPALTLIRKILLVSLPFVILFVWSAVTTQTPSRTQRSLLEDKIQRLIVTASTTPRVIIAGESQSEAGVVPAVFTKLTGLPTVNVSVGNGTLPEMYDAFIHDNVLRTKRILIMGVNSYEINDRYNDNQPIYKVAIDAGPFGIQKLQDESAYYSALALYYLNNFKNFIRMNVVDNTHMDAATFARGGNSSNVATLRVLPANTKDSFNPWYTNAKMDGLKQQAFVEAVGGLGETASTVIIYIAPVAPSWKESLAGKDTDVENQFMRIIEGAIAPYPNLHFFDFRSVPSPLLTDTEFMDNFHLNDTGAAIFTTQLVATLREKHLLR